MVAKSKNPKKPDQKKEKIKTKQNRTEGRATKSGI
jgi:hypothetical protein